MLWGGFDGHLGGLLVPHLSRLGCLLVPPSGPSCAESGLCWAIMGPSGGTVWPFGGPGPSWAVSEPSWDPLLSTP
eukprot:5292432-Pyramimonas_sp.AAC.1